MLIGKQEGDGLWKIFSNSAPDAYAGAKRPCRAEEGARGGKVDADDADRTLPAAVGSFSGIIVGPQGSKLWVERESAVHNDKGRL